MLPIDLRPEVNVDDRINAILHESCIVFCELCGCGIPRETCVSLGKCNDYDEYRAFLRTYLINKYKND